MSEERITIAIPYHGGRAYLERALDSALTQSVPPAAIVVSDDSDDADESARLAARLSDAGVRHVRADPGHGMGANWNRCLDLAQTELVTLLHADDELLPDYCMQMQAAAAAAPRAAAVFCGATIIGANGAPRFSFADYVKKWLTPPGEGPILLAGESGLRLLLRGNFVMCPTLCWRRSVLAQRRFAPGLRQVQDLELMCRLLLEGESLVGARFVAYAYRRHETSATALQSESLLRFEEESALYEAVAKTARARGWLAAAKTAEARRIIRLHLLFRMGLDLVKLHPGRIPAKLRLLSKERETPQRRGGKS